MKTLPLPHTREVIIVHKYPVWSFVKKDLYLVITQKLIFLDFMWICRISNPADFMKSTWKHYKSNNSRRTHQFHGVQWEGYVSWFHVKFTGFHVKFAGFHEIRSERPIANWIVRPMFYTVSELSISNVLVNSECLCISAKTIEYLAFFS